MKFEIDVRPSPSLAPPPLHSPRAPPLPQPPTSTWRNETRGGPVVPVDTRGRSGHTDTHARAHTHQTHVRPPGVNPIGRESGTTSSPSPLTTMSWTRRCGA